MLNKFKKSAKISQFMQKSSSRIINFFLLITVLAFFSSCAGYHKLKAAKVLKNCAYSFKTAEILSFTPSPHLTNISSKGGLGHSGLAIINTITAFINGEMEDNLGEVELLLNINAINPNQEELRIDSIHAEVWADTIFKLPLNINQATTIKKDTTSIIPLKTTVILNKDIFLAKTVKDITIKGKLYISLNDNQKTTLPLNIKRQFSDEDKAILIDSIRETIINNMVSGWMKNLGQ